MSGPKASDYTLERRRQEALRRAQEAERKRREAIRRAQEEERRRKEEEQRRKEEIRRNAMSIAQNIETAVNAVKNAKSLMQKQMVRMASMGIPVSKKVIEDIDNRLNQLKQTFADPTQLAEKRGASAVTECRFVCSSIIEDARNIGSQAGKMETQIQNKTANLVKNEQGRIRARAEREKKEKQDQLKKAELEKHRAAEQKALQEVEKIQSMFEKYSHMLPLAEVKELEETYQKHLTEIIDSQSNFPEFLCTQLHNFLTIAEADLRKKASLWQEIVDLQTKYAALCDMLERPVYDLPQDKQQLVAMCDQASKELEERETRLQVEKALQECMEEMGYSLLGKRSDSINDTTDSLYHMHGQTVLRVSHSRTGQIAMEIGLGETRHRVMQESEVSELVRDMGSFCGAYDEFKRRLRSKGIVEQEELFRFPASDEFAHTIDLSEFGVKEEAIQAVAQQEAGRQEGFSEQAQLYQYIDNREV